MKLATTAIACLLTAIVLTGCNDYGTKLDIAGSDVYYKNVSKEEAEKLGNHLKEIGYITEKKKVSVQLDKAGEIYQVRLVVVDNFKELDAYPLGFQKMAAVISNKVFDDNPVEIHLADSRFKTVGTVTLDSLGRIVPFGDSDVFYTKGVEKKEAQALGEMLQKAKYFTKVSKYTVQLGKDGENYKLGFVVVDDYKKKPAAVIMFRFLGARAARELFKGKEVEVRLLSGKMKELETLKPLGAPRGKTPMKTTLRETQPTLR